MDSELPGEKRTAPHPGDSDSAIPYVVINGTIVVQDTALLKEIFSGQPVYDPIRVV